MILSGVALGQVQTQLGLNPPALRWKRINHTKFEVIFPQSLQHQAQKTASLLEFLYDSGAATIGPKRQKITVILQNQTTISNGFVALAPWRSEFFMTPPQVSFLGSGNWAELLAIHEFRHVQQYSNARQGLTGLASYAFGNFGWATFSYIATPRWFFEGDAVCYETALSESGRGRLPFFTQEWLALVREKRYFGYEKAAARSYRDFVPNHYSLGYFMTAYARKQYGDQVWEKVFARANAYKSPLYPFSRSLKKIAGVSVRQLYRNMLAQTDSLVRAEEKIYPLTISRKLNQKFKKRYTNYETAQFLDNQTIVFEKNSFNQISTFYQAKISDLKGNYVFQEKRLAVPGLNTSGKTLSASQKRIVWAELAYHPRWGYRDYSIVKLFDTVKKKKHKITSKSRLFSPALSPNGSAIAALEWSDSLQAALVIIELFPVPNPKKIANPDSFLIQTPKWIDDTTLVAVLQKNNRNALATFHLNSEKWTFLTAWLSEQISYPTSAGSYVYFSATFSSNNEIYRIKFADSDAQIEQITSTQSGATMPALSPNGQYLIYSEYSSMGYDLKLLQTAFIQPIAQQPPRLGYAQMLKEQENLGETAQNFPLKSYPVTDFKKSSDLFHLHSWSPYVFPPIYSLGLFLNNKMSTLSGSAQYEFNLNESTGNWIGSLNYGEFFPVFNAGFATSNRRANQADTIWQGNRGFIGTRVQSWSEKTAFVGFTLPFNLSHGPYLTGLNWQNQINFSEFHFNSSKDFPQNGFYTHFQSVLTFRRLRYTSRQEVLPRLGQAFQIRYMQMLANPKLNGQAFYLSSQWYFPGLLRSHSFYVMADYKAEDFYNRYKFPNYFFEVRGYQSGAVTQTNTKISLNYMLPLFNVDLALGPIAFIYRVRANGFYDHSFPTQSPPYPIWERRSMGVELICDFRFLRLIDLSAGLRYNRFFSLKSFERTSTWEFVFFGFRI
jgi:hypothetical protein